MDFIGQNWEDAGCVADGVPTLLCIFVVFENIINAALALSGVVAMFMLIFAGYKYITSQGDPEALQTAKMTAFYAVIGLIFVIFSFFLVQFLGDMLGVELLGSEETTTNPSGGRFGGE